MISEDLVNGIINFFIGTTDRAGAQFINKDGNPTWRVGTLPDLKGILGNQMLKPISFTSIPELIEEHLKINSITGGVFPFYQIDGIWYCQFGGLDLDPEDKAVHRAEGEENRELLEQGFNRLTPIMFDMFDWICVRFKIEKNVSYLENSGGGFRIAVKFVLGTKLEEANQFFEFMKTKVLEMYALELEGWHIEAFPKQATHSKDKFGNCLKLPLGKNQFTGNLSKILSEFDFTKQGMGYKIPEEIKTEMAEFCAIENTAPTVANVDLNSEVQIPNNLPSLTKSDIPNLTKIRAPNKDKLTGKLKVKAYIQENKQEIEKRRKAAGKNPEDIELLYWKDLIFDLWHFEGTYPQQVYNLLKEVQPEFKPERFEEMLKYSYHQPWGYFTDKATGEKVACKPFSIETLKTLYPTYTFDSAKKIKREKTTSVITDKERVETDPQEIKDYQDWLLKLNAKEYYKHINKFYGFFVAGEEENRMLLHYDLVGIYFKNPDEQETQKPFTILKSISSGGKNHVVDTSLRFFPSRNYKRLDSLSAMAAFYDNTLKDPDVLLLYIRESDKEGTPDSIKHLQEGPQVRASVIKFETKYFEIRHLGYISTISHERLEIDVINRTKVLMELDESYTQTDDILDFKLRAHKDLIERDIEKKKIFHELHLISESFKYLDWNLKVYVPYIELLKILFPEKKEVSVRRVSDYLLRIIKNIVILQQRNRSITPSIEGTRYVIAEIEDLEIALKVYYHQFSDLIQHTKESHRMILELAKRHSDISMKPFTKDEMHIMLRNYKPSEGSEKDTGRGISKKTLGRRLDELEAFGYIRIDKTKKTYNYEYVKDPDPLVEFKIEEHRIEIQTLIDEAKRKYVYKRTEEV